MIPEPPSPGFSTTIEALRLREWQLGPGQHTLVMDQFCADDFNLVVDDRADVHVNSKDGSFYLGWFPSGRPGTDSEGWKIAVTGTAKVRGYQMSFDTETPADIVAAAVARVLETSSRCDSRGSSRSPSGGPVSASPSRDLDTKLGHLPPEAGIQPARHS